MGRGGQWWQSTKIGAGPIPIETTEGWLLFYHGVITNCNGFVYSVGCALLDRDNPTRVIYRTNEYLLSPAMDYETVGFVPNVCFPCAAICDAPNRPDCPVLRRGGHLHRAVLLPGGRGPGVPEVPLDGVLREQLRDERWRAEDPHHQSRAIGTRCSTIG